MMKAVHETNYDGYFVYLHGNNIESLRTVHTYKNGHEIERLFSLNGEAREIVRDNETVTRIVPNDRKIATTRRLLNKTSFSDFFVLDLDKIEKNYEVLLQGKGRIADRATNIIAFMPKDTLRYGYRLYLDDESALPLQWEMFDHNNRLVSSIMFTQITIGSSVADTGNLLEGGKQSELGKKRSAKAQADLSHKSQVPSRTETITKTANLKGSDWQFAELPKGFAMMHHRNGIPGHKNRNIEHFIFSDGMASFSVYIEQTDKARLDGQAQLGALNAFGVYLDGYQVTAVGEVPVQTLGFISRLGKQP